MDLGIAGKIAVVTGGTHGMGRSISEELGRNGCKVVVVARGRAYPLGEERDWPGAAGSGRAGHLAGRGAA